MSTIRLLLSPGAFDLFAFKGEYNLHMRSVYAGDQLQGNC